MTLQPPWGGCIGFFFPFPCRPAAFCLASESERLYLQKMQFELIKGAPAIGPSNWANFVQERLVMLSEKLPWGPAGLQPGPGAAVVGMGRRRRAARAQGRKTKLETKGTGLGGIGLRTCWEEAWRRQRWWACFCACSSPMAAARRAFGLRAFGLN